MNTPKPCDVCKKLYTNVMFEDDASYLSECKEGRELGDMNCVGFIHWIEKMNPQLKRLRNKRVILTTVKLSKYVGTLTGISVGANSIHLSNLIILNKDGSYKAVSGNPNENKRWFNIESVKTIEEIRDNEPF